MKTMFKTSLAALLLLMAVSCKKENSSLKSSPANVESSTKDQSADNAVAATTLIIGTQRWMPANLTVAKYRNGDPIKQVKNPGAWANLTTGAWCWYNNDSVNGRIYGRLYNWYAVNDPRGLAPTGWHIPSDAEWTTLATFLGGDAVAGGKMKEIGTTHWLSPNVGATNSSSFTALPGGMRQNGGSVLLGSWSSWWSSTPDVFDPNYYWGRFIFSDYEFLGRGLTDKSYGYAVRCIKD